MVERIYARLDQCTVCGKTYKGPVALWRHLAAVHAITDDGAKRRHMRQIPNPAYRGPV